MRKLVILAAILGSLFLGANLVAERAAEAALGRAAGKAIGLDGDVEIDLKGFPILLDVLGGRLDGVSASVRDRRVGDLMLARVEVTLEDLRAEGSIIGSGPLTIVAARTRVVAETGEDEVNAFLRRRDQDASVRLLDGEVEVTAKRRFAGQTRTVTATGPLRLDGRVLVFRPREVSWDGPTVPGWEQAAREAATIREELPDLPGSTRIQSIEVTGGSIRLAARLEGQRIKVR